MPPPGVPLERLGFLTIGLFDGDNPGPGHQTTLEIIELGERLGFDSAWLRDRHLQYGISSPVAVLAAASQRTRRIELGTAVIPLGWENPLRLAEDLGTVDVLSGGRINPGVSVGRPMHFDEVKDALYPDTADVEDFSYERVSPAAGPDRGRAGQHVPGRPGHRAVLQPGRAALARAAQPDLVRRRQHGLGALGRRAPDELPDQQRGPGRGSTDFAAIQQAQIRAFRDAHPDGAGARVSQGLVVIPTDSATAAQRAKYAAYVEARTPRTASPQGPARMMFARDLLGSAARSPRRCTRTPASARSGRSPSRCRSASTRRTTSRS